MENASREFLDITSGLKVIACEISHKDDVYNLKTEYTTDEYEQFLSDINFGYNSDYGSQELYGTIWCTNNIWITRGEYDGSEWWDVNEMPKISKVLRNIDRERDKIITDILDK